MKRNLHNNRKRGFTIRDLAVMLTGLLIAAGLVMSLSGATRSLSQTSACTSNLETLFGGLMAYVNVYNSFPPHSPYPSYVTTGSGGASSYFDPNIGWIMTYGLGMTPPATDLGGHFTWWVLNACTLPPVCICPAANEDLLFTPNPETDPGNPESVMYQYAAFYQTPGTCRAATPIVTTGLSSQGIGGRNPPVPAPVSTIMTSVYQPCKNMAYAGGSGIASGLNVPGVYVFQKKDPATDPSKYGNEIFCWIQAVHPAEIQQPSRLYYLADSRDYRINGMGAAQCDGWFVGYGNQLYLGSRHNGYSNVMYLDGQVNRDNQAHPSAKWSLAYDGLGRLTNAGPADQWRAATFADDVSLASIHTQHHEMPVLMVKGWEYFFSADGVAAR